MPHVINILDGEQIYSLADAFDILLDVEGIFPTSTCRYRGLLRYSLNVAEVNFLTSLERSPRMQRKS